MTRTVNESKLSNDGTEMISPVNVILDRTKSTGAVNIECKQSFEHMDQCFTRSQSTIIVERKARSLTSRHQSLMIQKHVVTMRDMRQQSKQLNKKYSDQFQTLHEKFIQLQSETRNERLQYQQSKEEVTHLAKQIQSLHLKAPTPNNESLTAVPMELQSIKKDIDALRKKWKERDVKSSEVIRTLRENKKRLLDQKNDEYIEMQNKLSGKVKQIKQLRMGKKKYVGTICMDIPCNSRHWGCYFWNSK
eukprot:1076998_1